MAPSVAPHRGLQPEPWTRRMETSKDDEERRPPAISAATTHRLLANLVVRLCANDGSNCQSIARVDINDRGYRNGPEAHATRSHLRNNPLTNGAAYPNLRNHSLDLWLSLPHVGLWSNHRAIIGVRQLFPSAVPLTRVPPNPPRAQSDPAPSLPAGTGPFL